MEKKKGRERRKIMMKRVEKRNEEKAGREKNEKGSEEY